MSNCIKFMFFSINVLTLASINHKQHKLYLEIRKKSSIPPNNVYNSILTLPAIKDAGQRHHFKTLHQFPCCHTTDSITCIFFSTLAPYILEKPEKNGHKNYTDIIQAEWHNSGLLLCCGWVSL